VDLRIVRGYPFRGEETSDMTHCTAAVNSPTTTNSNTNTTITIAVCGMTSGDINLKQWRLFPLEWWKPISPWLSAEEARSHDDKQNDENSSTEASNDDPQVT